jgi:hypothetical protein
VEDPAEEIDCGGNEDWPLSRPGGDHGGKLTVCAFDGLLGHEIVRLEADSLP